jgi:MoxR-like ATPase
MTFEIVEAVGGDAPHDARRTQAAAQRLHAHRPPADLADLAAAAPRFQVDEDLRTAINTALTVGAPLLLTGDPGTGKTQVAYYLAWYFGTGLFRYQVRSTASAEQLKFDFDAVAYLRSAHLQRDPGDARSERRDFVTKGPLWNCYDHPSRAVLLIDEIDKAPRDFPNDLLHELAEQQFMPPFAPEAEPIRPQAGPPIVVVTSNVERRLPDAFLRRCIYFHIEVTEELFRRAMEARGAGDFPYLDARKRALALKRFLELRALELEKPPSTGELLVWLAVLSARGTEAGTLERQPLARLPGIEALIKDREDLARLPGYQGRLPGAS